MIRFIRIAAAGLAPKETELLHNMEFASEQDLIEILCSEMKRALCYIGLDAAFSGQAGSPEKYEKMVVSLLSPIAGALLMAVNE